MQPIKPSTMYCRQYLPLAFSATACTMLDLLLCFSAPAVILYGQHDDELVHAQALLSAPRCL